MYTVVRRKNSGRTKPIWVFSGNIHFGVPWTQEYGGFRKCLYGCMYLLSQPSVQTTEPISWPNLPNNVFLGNIWAQEIMLKQFEINPKFLVKRKPNNQLLMFYKNDSVVFLILVKDGPWGPPRFTIQPISPKCALNMFYVHIPFLQTISTTDHILPKFAQKYCLNRNICTRNYFWIFFNQLILLCQRNLF